MSDIIVSLFISFISFTEEISVSQVLKCKYTPTVHRKGTTDKNSSRLTSAVKPIMEPLQSEAVIDIKPEMDDDLIAEEHAEISTNHSQKRGTSSRPTAEIYRPGQSKLTSVSTADPFRSTEGSSHSRQLDSRSSRTPRSGSSKVWINEMDLQMNKSSCLGQLLLIDGSYRCCKKMLLGNNNNNVLSFVSRKRSHGSARRP